MSASAVLTIAAVGPGATIQDAGRFGLLRFGITPAGPMDAFAFATANAVLGNAPEDAAIEIGPGGIALGCDAPLLLAFAGGGLRWTRDHQALPSTARVILRPGEVLRARAGAWGQWGYLAVPGGFDVPRVMGSRATHVRSGMGGLEGRVLAGGDRLVSLRAPDRDFAEGEIDGVWLAPTRAPMRVLLGPQDDHFTASAVELFLGASWTITAAADRMAYALEGPSIAHGRDFNIVSDGVALGAIQVAGNGKPLVLMADRQPTGGYPKIAHVCRADIGRLAQLRPGQACRFTAVDLEEARCALFALDRTLADLPRHLSPLRRDPSIEILTASNLIGGVTDGAD